MEQSHSFLNGQFMRIVSSEECKLHALQSENDSLREQLKIVRSGSRVTAAQHRKLLEDVTSLLTRNSLNVSSSSPLMLEHPELAIYSLAASLKPDKTNLDGPIGRELLGHVVTLMTSHFWKLVGHVEFCTGKVCGSVEEYEYMVRVLLLNLMMFVFGVHVPDWSQFSAQKGLLTLKQEVPLLLKASMSVRSYHTTQNTFPVNLLYTFISNWNNFAVKELQFHPLPLEPDVRLNKTVMRAMVFSNNLECECVLSRKLHHHDHKGATVTIRLYLRDPQQQSPSRQMTQPPRMLRNSPAISSSVASSSSSSVMPSATLPASVIPVADAALASSH